MPKQNRGPPPDSRLELHGEEEIDYILSLGNSEDVLDVILDTRVQARKYYAERQRQQTYYEKNRERKLQYQQERRAMVQKTETPAQKDARKAARRMSQELYRELNRDHLRAQQAQRYRLKHRRTSLTNLPRNPSVLFTTSVMPPLDWPTTLLPPFERPSHWPWFIDHDNIYLTGEAEKQAILSGFEVDESTSEEAKVLLVESCMGRRIEYRRRMAVIRPHLEKKIQNSLFLHTKQISRSLNRPITIPVLNEIRLAARERAELAIHYKLRDEDMEVQKECAVRMGRAKLWVDID
ncbi:hypothetical protein FB446DRAFT_795347 [Lentinula raphanica]|nr:hypothetical protein FB446DRAFT_795347 [Lentinula raphanica]